jgi:hypothetical protein
MEEEGNLFKSAVCRCPDQASTIEVEFCRAASSLREHLLFAEAKQDGIVGRT